MLTVAPVTCDPGPTSTGTGSPVSSEVSTALRALDHDAVGGDLLARADGEHVADRSDATGTRRSVRRPASSVVSSATSVAPSDEQAAQGVTRPTPGAVLRVAAGEQERGHDGGDLEVQLGRLHAGHAPARGTSVGSIRMPISPAPPSSTAHSDHAGRGDDAERDERVHGRRAVPGRARGGPVERPGGPRDDGQGERGDDPLPAGELQRRDHRQQRARARSAPPRR